MIAKGQRKVNSVHLTSAALIMLSTGDWSGPLMKKPRIRGTITGLLRVRGGTVMGEAISHHRQSLYHLKMRVNCD
jgi:hypothetical protein